MAGVRLHHPTLRAPATAHITFVVELETEWANRRPRHCKTCSVEHDHKAIHLKVDQHGDTIVSAEVLELLRPMFFAGFEVANEVENPPTQYIGAIDQPQLLVVEHKLNTDQNPDPAYRPRITRHESQARLEKAFAALGKE